MKRIVLCLQIFLLLSRFSYSTQAQYTSIFSFGDSYTDTGNKAIISGPATPDLWITKPPYGMTFFGHPTGRLSDSRLIIDFIACKEYLAKALFVVGELGWNDYGIMLVGGKSVAEVQSYIPRIVGTISAATEKLINEGATAILVSGISPMGCAPGNLVFLGSQNKADTGCLRSLNLLSREHNAQLREALARVGGRHPGARVAYADLYAPVIGFAASPARYGFAGRGRRAAGLLRRRRPEVPYAALCPQTVLSPAGP
ncbi:hypothetical protein C2845_PM07G38750 [Panicum miliaceum]|uniref:GDSL esterase/lipase n=1 Tax=Panicum miliaceum TaxID=4540 RepID=A0A3L6SK55_PANMI|nr:hypothetical protein C2845_PM07G38750 [Panicum miliaceum]